MAKPVFPVDSERGVSRGYMGVTIQPVTEELAQSFGLKHAKGALVNDVIKVARPTRPVSVRGCHHRPERQRSQGPIHLQRQVAEAGIGKVAKISIFRDGKAPELSITWQRRCTQTAAREERGGRQQEGEADLLGLIVENAEQGDGVVVVDAVRDGIAAESGIKRGDVIVSINRKELPPRRNMPVSSSRPARGQPDNSGAARRCEHLLCITLKIDAIVLKSNYMRNINHELDR
jgi:serine protease Do/serine protease DegQ